MSQIHVGDNESLEQALRRFTKRVQSDGILMDYRKHEYYEKPSEKRARERAEAVRRARKLERKRLEREL